MKRHPEDHLVTHGFDQRGSQPLWSFALFSDESSKTRMSGYKQTGNTVNWSLSAPTAAYVSENVYLFFLFYFFFLPWSGV